MAIDWNAPLEAVHRDGRIVPVTADPGHDYVEIYIRSENACFPEGYHYGDGKSSADDGWIVRNRSEIKPCPFCGVQGIVFDDDKHLGWMAMCGKDCEMLPQTAWKATRQEAVAAWNARAAPATDAPDAATIALCATIVSEEGPQNPEHDWTDYARARGSMRDNILKRFAALAKHPTSPEDAA